MECLSGKFMQIIKRIFFKKIRRKDAYTFTLSTFSFTLLKSILKKLLMLTIDQYFSSIQCIFTYFSCKSECSSELFQTHMYIIFVLADCYLFNSEPPNLLLHKLYTKYFVERSFKCFVFFGFFFNEEPDSYYGNN